MYFLNKFEKWFSRKKFHFIQEKSGVVPPSQLFDPSLYTAVGPNTCLMPIGRLVCLLAGSGILVSVKSMQTGDGTIHPDTVPPLPKVPSINI